MQMFRLGYDSSIRKVERWAREIVRGRFGRMGGETEDVIQDAVAGAWKAVAQRSFTLKRDLRAFVRRIAIARGIDRFRRKRPQAELSSSIQAREIPPDEEFLQEDMRAQLRLAIGKMNPECQTLIEERFFEGLSFAEMAKRHGKAEATMRVKVFHCLRKIRSILGAGENVDIGSFGNPPESPDQRPGD